MHKKNLGLSGITTPIIMLIFLMVTLLTGMAGCGPALTGERLEVGLLVPRTGSLSYLGENSQAGLELSAKDINDYLGKAEAGFHISLITEDAGDTPESAMEAFLKLAERDINVVIAPVISEQVVAIIEKAQEKDILLLVPTSTAVSLAEADNNLFRLVTTDNKQVEAILYRLESDGKKAMVTLNVDDIYGRDLTEAFGQKAGSLAMAGAVSYSPRETDHTQTISELKKVVNDAIAEYGAENVAVLMVSFEEAVDILREAGKEEVLSSVQWYGTDSFAQSEFLLKDKEAAAFAVKAKLTCSIFHSRGEGTDRVLDELTKKLKRIPDDYALISYDALRLTALTYEKAGKDAHTELLKKELPVVAGGFMGVSGLLTLNEFGDRLMGNYGFWQVTENEEGEYEWIKVFWYNG